MQRPRPKTKAKVTARECGIIGARFGADTVVRVLAPRTRGLARGFVRELPKQRGL